MAVKVLTGVQNEDAHAKFIKEISLLRRARHPHIVQYLGACIQVRDLCPLPVHALQTMHQAIIMLQIICTPSKHHGCTVRHVVSQIGIGVRFQYGHMSPVVIQSMRLPLGCLMGSPWCLSGTFQMSGAAPTLLAYGQIPIASQNNFCTPASAIWCARVRWVVHGLRDPALLNCRGRTLYW